MKRAFAPANVPARHFVARGRFKRALAFGTIVVALSSTFALSKADPAAAATGHVTGTVFRDFNQNGVYDSTVGADGLTDAPLKGVTATVYNGAGTAVGTAVTTATGAYDITVTPVLPNGTPLRIQISGFPAGFVDSFSGAGNGTSVQFTTVNATGVNFALHKTTDYSRGTTGTPLITAIQTNGSASTNNTTAITNAPALTAILPSAAVNTAAPTAAKSLATFGEIGAVWGVATQSLGHTAAGDRYYVYASAVTKRHSDWGPKGIDGLYRLDVTVAANGTVTRNAITSFDLTATGVNYGTVGTVSGGTTAAQGGRDFIDRSTGTAGVQSLDAGALAAAGKVGIGGIAYDNGYLYVTNLNDKKIWRYDVTTLATPAPTVIDPALGANEHPWAIAVNNGSLYVGVTNDTTMATGAKVISRPIASGTFTTALTVPLNYARGIGWDADSPTHPTTGQPAAQWHSWEDNPATLFTDTTDYNGWFRAYAEPILSGLTFDDGGNLSLGFLDRFSYQTGFDGLWPTGANTWMTTNGNTAVLITGLPVGDLLYAGRSSTGTLVLENATGTNGTVAVTTPGQDNVTRTPGYGPDGVAAGETARENVQHGGREFFEDGVGWNGKGGITGQGVVHDETTLGAVTTLAGSNQIASTSFDAANTYNAAGNRFLSLIDGHSIDGFDQYLPAGDTDFGKGGGIGGVSFLLADAPVEIGNRVWYDADLNGIQDPDEPAINGAPVQLWTADGSGNPVTQLGSTTTATLNGQPGTYYFRSEDAPSGGTTGFVKNANYVVVFPAAAAATAVNLQWPGTAPAGFTGMTWGQLQRTVATSAGSTPLNDSNPNVANGYAPVTVGGMGQNDHSIDAGWFGMSAYRLTKTVVGTAATGQTFTLNVASATNFRGDDRKWVAGAATNPIVDTLSYALNAGQTVTTTELVPYGYVLTFTESGVPGAAVAFAPFTGTDDTGSIVVTPAAAGSETRVTATNSLTAITVTKALSPVATLPAGTTFPVEYTIDGGASTTVQVAVGAGNTVTIAGIPWSSTVKLREPLTGPFSWGGFVWASGTWAQGATALTPDASGWVTVTAPSSTTALALTLTNHPYLPPDLPMAGGLGADAFTIGGGIVIALALGLGLWQLKLRVWGRRRRVAMHRA
ncbi:MAG: SdrD B-like domain-containing protein [Rhodoglobus sp.]